MTKIKRQKPLLPSLKEKKRYLVYEAMSKNQLDRESLQKEIKKGFGDYVGSLGMAKAGIMFLKDWKNNKGIVRINNNYVDNLRATLVQVNSVKDDSVLLRSVGVSGILKKARNKFLEEDI